MVQLQVMACETVQSSLNAGTTILVLVTLKSANSNLFELYHVPHQWYKLLQLFSVQYSFQMLLPVLYIFHSCKCTCVQYLHFLKHFLIGGEEIIAVTRVLQYLKTPDQIGKCCHAAVVCLSLQYVNHL